MALPPQTQRPTSGVDTQQRFDKREKSIDRWLAVMGIGMTAAAAFLTAIAVAAVVLGFFSFQRFRQIETEARQHMEAAKEYAEEAMRLVEEITAVHDEAQVRLAELNAEVVGENPTEAARTVADVRADPAASVIDRAIAAAVQRQQQGNIEGAIEKWRAIANVAGEENRQLQAQAWFSVGYLYHERDDLETAIDAYTKAIELNPALAGAYNNRGNAKSNLSQYQAALADYDRAIELNPAWAGAYTNRGLVKRDLGQYQAALADHDRAIELNPALGRSLHQSRPCKA